MASIYREDRSIEDIFKSEKSIGLGARLWEVRENDLARQFPTFWLKSQCRCRCLHYEWKYLRKMRWCSEYHELSFGHDGSEGSQRYPSKDIKQTMDIKLQNLEERAELETPLCQLASELLPSALEGMRSFPKRAWNKKRRVFSTKI